MKNYTNALVQVLCTNIISQKLFIILSVSLKLVMIEILYYSLNCG
jgi:hypothetical protein